MTTAPATDATWFDNFQMGVIAGEMIRPTFITTMSAISSRGAPKTVTEVGQANAVVLASTSSIRAHQAAEMLGIHPIRISVLIRQGKRTLRPNHLHTRVHLGIV